MNNTVLHFWGLLPPEVFYFARPGDCLTKAVHGSETLPHHGFIHNQGNKALRAATDPAHCHNRSSAIESLNAKQKKWVGIAKSYLHPRAVGDTDFVGRGDWI